VPAGPEHKHFDLVNPITGPVYVRGAEPGEVLAVEILELRPRDWGWTAIIPGFGLLADEFTEPWLRISQVDGRRGRVSFADDISLPFAPFPGTIGVAPPEPGRHSVIPPRRRGGNVDVKHLPPGHLDRHEAYAIASVAADLRMHEVVDSPNWVVAPSYRTPSSPSDSRP
jgi:acetamidase/formamidase